MRRSGSQSIARGFLCTLCQAQRSGGLKLLHPLSISRSALQPLHASPNARQSRYRHDQFFSSSTILGAKAKSEQSASSDGFGLAYTEQQAKFEPGQLSQHHRIGTRSPAVKTSLRRVAVEAQRSKEGSQGTSSDGLTTSGSLDESLSSVSHDAPSARLVTAYAVAETFNLAKVVTILKDRGYKIDPMRTGLYPQVVHIQVPISSTPRSTSTSTKDLLSSDVGDIFIFPSGTLVTWALPDGFTSYFARRTLLPAAESPNEDPIETEDLEFLEDPTREQSIIRGETIIVGTRSPQHNRNTAIQPISTSTILTKIAFSSGFARSTKLAVLESNLSTYLASTSQIPQHLSTGNPRLPAPFSSRRFILRKTGELLLLRAQLNLYSELTDSLPDLFWDSRYELNLENYYDQVGRALDVGIRIKILNEKMDYAAEMAAVLRETLSERHSLFLEWTIIVLIAIEVGFEVLRLWKEGFWSEVFGHQKHATVRDEAVVVEA